MDRQTIITMLGEEVYASEGAAARRAAPHTGYRSPPYAYASPVPEEIGALVWATPEAELDAQGKIRLLFACYRDIPKISFVELVMQSANTGLKEAADMLDCVLAYQEVSFSFETEEAVQAFARDVVALGGLARVEASTPE